MDSKKKEVVEKNNTKKTPKKKMKPRGGNSPMIGMNGYNLEPGDNSKFLAVSMELMNLPKIDIRNDEQVKERLDLYFQIQYEFDCKPTVAGMAMALGISRQSLWAIRTNSPMGGTGNMPNLPPHITDRIKRAYFLMENLWENYMVNGKINPVTGIFLGKNNFGYQDKTEYVVTPNQNTDSEYSAADIRERYIGSAEPKRLSTIDYDEKKE